MITLPVVDFVYTIHGIYESSPIFFVGHSLVLTFKLVMHSKKERVSQAKLGENYGKEEEA